MTEPSPPPESDRIAVVLASSFFGVYAHAGFLQGLTDAGIRPGRIAGASAGALAGALFSAGLRGDDLRSAAIDPALRLSFADLGALWRLPGVATSFWSTGIFSGHRMVAHLRDLLGTLDLSELELDIALTNFTTSAPEVRREGPLAELVMASCAVPWLFTIQQVDDKRYLDGGIACERPFEHLLDDPRFDTIIIHTIQHEPHSGPNVRWETVSNVIGTAHTTSARELHRLRSNLAEHKGKHLIEIESHTPFPGFFSNKHAPLCYQRGLESAATLPPLDHSWKPNSSNSSRATSSTAPTP